MVAISYTRLLELGCDKDSIIVADEFSTMAYRVKDGKLCEARLDMDWDWNESSITRAPRHVLEWYIGKLQEKINEQEESK